MSANARRCFLPILAALAVTGGSAFAGTPQVVQSTPAAEEILDGRNLQFVIRFDRPVDHLAARLEVTQDGKSLLSLHPLMDSAPDVLFASVPALSAGRYSLHWHLGAAFGGEAVDGDVPFSIRR